MKGQEITYSEVRIFTFPNMTVEVYIPDLTEEEQKRRHKLLEKSAEEILKAQIRAQKGRTK